ncbi:MAG: hypothetical protein AAFV88_17185 [Planctomycetota bacterium]
MATDRGEVPRLNFWLPLLILVLLLGGAVTALFWRPSQAMKGKLPSGRQVSAVSDAVTTTLQFEGNVATIKAGQKIIEVKPDSVWVDGQQYQEIDPNEMNIHVSYVGGTVNIEEGE